MTNKTETLCCSFCGKSQHEVKKLIVGPNVFICNECIDLCSSIVSENKTVSMNSGGIGRIPTPKEICKILDDYVEKYNSHPKFNSNLINNSVKYINEIDDYNNKLYQKKI